MTELPFVAEAEPARAAAFHYLRAGLHPLPVCRPVPGAPGGCGCPWHRDLPGHAAGKTPCLGSGDLRRALEGGPPARDPGTWPWEGANVALALRPSGLAVLDLDGPKAAAEAAALGLPPSAGVVRGDHAHRYYRLPAGVPAARAVRRGASGRIDVLAAGYVVAPPSRHVSGERYALRCPGPIAPLPGWAVELLRRASEHVRPASALPEGPPPPEVLGALRTCRVPAWVLERIQAGDGTGDRSRTDWSVTRALVERGVPDPVIAAIYRNPEWRIGAKYRERRDPDRYLGAMLCRHHAEIGARSGPER